MTDEARREKMVAEQIAGRGVSDPRVLAAMRTVPRHLFLPAEAWDLAYTDRPVRIGEGQTISQPYIVALMAELLEVHSGDKVLDVGTGSGYQAAVLGQLAAEVHSIERFPSLAKTAAARLADLAYDNIHVHIGDGTLGYPPEAPYDRIIVGAAAPFVPPALRQQLADGGRLVLPVGSRTSQHLEIWERMGDDFRKTEAIPVVFVPLVGEEGWQAD